MARPDVEQPALGAFARRGTDLRFVHLRDAGEYTLAFDQAAVFFSPEDGTELALDPAGAREAFAEVVKEYIEEVYRGVTRWGGVYQPANTSRPLEETLRKVIGGRPATLEAAWA